jgi:hypothetical protein
MIGDGLMIKECPLCHRNIEFIVHGKIGHNSYGEWWHYSDCNITLNKALSSKTIQEAHHE